MILSKGRRRHGALLHGVESGAHSLCLCPSKEHGAQAGVKDSSSAALCMLVVRTQVLLGGTSSVLPQRAPEELTSVCHGLDLATQPPDPSRKLWEWHHPFLVGPDKTGLP